MKPISNCGKCGLVRKRKPSGQPYCGACAIAYNLKNKDKFKETTIKWKIRNKERLVKKRKLYRRENATHLAEYKKDYGIKNKTRVRESSRQYRLRQHLDHAVWKNMKNRCNNPNSESYKNYGGRGISVCIRWNSFANFITDMGDRPAPQYLYTLERINVNGNYEPINCKWLLKSEQNNNTRRNIKYKLSIPDDSLIGYQDKLITLKEFSDLTKLPLIICKYRSAQHPDCTEWILNDDYDNRYYELDGFKYNMSELSLMSGVSYGKLRQRIIQYNWSIEKAMELVGHGL